MPNKFVFADEAGNFDFSRKNGASRYFLLTTITTVDCSVGEAILSLRRDLAWKGLDVGDGFHATEDQQAVRDAVFGLLAQHSFRVDSTILEKPKAQPHLAADEHAFFKLAWYLHFKHVARDIVQPGDELQIVSASLGTKKKRAQFCAAVEEVAKQVVPLNTKWRVSTWSAASDPCLQAADCCCWAIQRKWERADLRSHGLIAGKIRTEFDCWRTGTTNFY